MPFVTEECWAAVPGATGEMITHGPPQAPGPRDEGAEAEVARLQEVVTAIRAFRDQRGLKRREPLLVDLSGVEGADAIAPEALAALAGARAERPGDGVEPSMLAVPAGRMAIWLERGAGAEDLEAERTRLREAVAKAESELARARRQLANERFVERAPAELVDAEREKERRHAAEVEALGTELDQLERRAAGPA